MLSPRRDCLLGLSAVALAAACRPRTSARGRVMRAWAHQGQEAEHRSLQAIAAAFDHAARARGMRVEISFFPDFQYTEKLAIAAAANDMPDAFELDGPLVARFADAGLLAPLDELFASSEVDDFLPTVREQGTVDGRLYALGAYDSALVLYFDRAAFAKAGVVAPPPGRGFEWRELLGACAALKSAGLDPLALHMNESADEWYTYAFSPVVWSGGGSLIAKDGVQVRNVLAAPNNVKSLTAWQQLFANGYAATDPVNPDPFGSGTVAMDWCGHWMLRAHLASKRDRLGVMPLPRVGATTVAACGSWCWALSARSYQRAEAAAWLRWVLDAQHGIAPMVRANGAVPARHTAFAAFPEYRNMPYALLREQLELHARPRPRTPFYATLTQRFAGALRDIARGAPVERRLKQAEDEVASRIERRVGREVVRSP